jgi:hypothetical protein
MADSAAKKVRTQADDILAERESIYDRSVASVYRVIWGLGRHEDFPTAAEADARADEIHKGMVEDWPLLAGTNDGSLPRVVEVARV